MVHFSTERAKTIHILKKSVFLAALIEALTAGFRFGLGLESTRDTASTLGRLTFGIRIHHGYIGFLLAAIGLVLPAISKWRQGMLILGLSLLLSDFFHHFVVLNLVTGSPQFDFWYPASHAP